MVASVSDKLREHHRTFMQIHGRRSAPPGSPPFL